MQIIQGLGGFCAVSGLVPCEIIQATFLGHQKIDLSIVKVTDDQTPKLIGYLPTGWTLVEVSITDGVNTYGPFAVTVLVNEWTADVTDVPLGDYSISGMPAQDAGLNAKGVSGTLTIVGIGLAILAGPEFGILGSPDTGILATAEI